MLDSYDLMKVIEVFFALPQYYHRYEEEEKAHEPLLTIILDKLIEIGKEVANSSKKHAKTLNVTT